MNFGGPASPRGMSIKQLNPYIHLPGTAAQAIALYERVLGAKVEMRLPYQDKPDRILHAQLRIGPHVLMLNDSPEAHHHVVLDMDDVADSTARFDALAAGGKVAQPRHDAFYGARMGALVDAYGVAWMFNINK